MKAWHAAVVLVCLSVGTFLGIERMPGDGDPHAMQEPGKLILGVRGDARFDATPWDQELARDALRQAGFEIVYEDDWNVHARHGSDGPVVKLLPMGDGVLLHMLHELDAAVPYDGEDDPAWRSLETRFHEVVRAIEEETGWRHASVDVQPLLTDG